MENAQRVNRRPGILWAFVQFPLTRIVIAAVALVAVVLGLDMLRKASGAIPHSGAGVLFALLAAAAALAIYCLFVRVVERRVVTELSTARALPEFGSGVLLGFVLFATVILVLCLIGVGNVTSDGSWTALMYSLVGAIVAAVFEESLMRGVLFRIVEESLGSWIALAISAATFGGLHAFNAGATPISSIAIALEAGVLLAASYMYTRRLWMPIGLHLGWNFTEGGLFGASVSGGNDHGLFTSHFQGHELLTGGKFGPEASLITVGICFVVGVVLVGLAARRRHIIAVPWRRARSV